jgi:solute carrier family 25 carnitine/acylcarnitine transporter 20/29
MSALSQSDQHTTFIRLLQRSKAIPLLAHINATLFAPTDAAWEAWFGQHTPESSQELYQGWLSSSGLSEWLIDEEDAFAARLTTGSDAIEERRLLDNQNWALRQHMLYHILNYTISPSHFLADDLHSNITTETTLLFPLAEKPSLPPTPPPGPPWVPRGGEGMLGGRGQRLRLATAGSTAGGARGKVGINHQGDGGASVWDGSGWEQQGNLTAQNRRAGSVLGGRWVRNGVVVGIDGVLEPPASIGE